LASSSSIATKSKKKFIKATKQKSDFFDNSSEEKQGADRTQTVLSIEESIPTQPEED
jgi:hypothetical protein